MAYFALGLSRCLTFRLHNIHITSGQFFFHSLCLKFSSLLEGMHVPTWIYFVIEDTVVPGFKGLRFRALKPGDVA